MRRLLVLACSIVLVDTLFYSALVPLIPHFRAALGLSKFEVGVLGGAFGAGVLAGSIPGGYLVAKAGAKISALFGSTVFVLTSLGFALAHGSWALVLARFGEGFGSAFSWVAAFTWLVSSAGEERRGQLIGTLMSCAVVGALLGPVVGSAAAVFGIGATFCAVAAFGALIGLWVFLTPAPPRQQDEPFMPMLVRLLRPNVAVGMWFILLSPLLFGAPVVLVPLALDRLGWDAGAIGAVFLVSAAFEAAAQPLLGRWSDTANHGRPLFFGLVGSTAVLLVLAAGEWKSGLFLAALVVAAGVFFNGSVTPGTALFSRSAGKAGVDQALVFGATNLAWATGSAAGAPVAGYLADAGGDSLSYLALAAVCGLTFLGLLAGKKREAKS